MTHTELFIRDANGEMKPLGKVVEGSTRLESDVVSDFAPTKDSLSYSFETTLQSKWFEEKSLPKPLQEAQNMLTRMRDYYALWHKYYGFGRRKERRIIVRKFKALAQRFNKHCKLYGITIKQQQ